jgi:hypothetical protein
MKVISPVVRENPKSPPVKQVNPTVKVAEYLKLTYPIPSSCNKMDIRPLWDEYHYRINYWGNQSISKNGSDFIESQILESMMVSIKCINGQFVSNIISPANQNF